MKGIESILRVLKKKLKTNTLDTPEGFCPNCWGRQEYGDKFYEAALNKNVNFNDPKPHLGWIQEYVEKNISPMELKEEDDMLVCSKCKLTYRPT